MSDLTEALREPIALAPKPRPRFYILCLPPDPDALPANFAPIAVSEANGQAGG